LAKLKGEYIKLYDQSQVMHSLHEVRYIIDGFIEAGALGMLWGPPGSFKSFIALDWALCVATGTKWFGLPVRQGPVIYIAGEGRRGIARRMKAWCTANSIDPASITDFYATSGAVNAREPHFAKEIVAMSEVIGKPALIVIDTLARNFGGGDENSAQDVGQLIDVVDRQLAQALGCTVLLVHHSKKEGGDYRGSSALKGAVDFEYEVTRKGDTLECTLTCKKMKDSEQQKPVTFKLGKSGSFDPVISDDEAIAEMLS
jgi:RecA-family ATPase